MRIETKIGLFFTVIGILLSGFLIGGELLKGIAYAIGLFFLIVGLIPEKKYQKLKALRGKIFKKE